MKLFIKDFLPFLYIFIWGLMVTSIVTFPIVPHTTSLVLACVAVSNSGLGLALSTWADL